MENKQTAVDFLWTKASNGEHLTPEDFERAKAMEQDSIVQAYSNGWHDGQDLILNQVIHIDAGGDKAGEQYFNETFKTEDNGE